MSACDELDLIGFLKGGLEEAESESILAHLEVCEKCRDRLRVMAAVEAVLPEGPSRRMGRRWWLLAAGVLLASAAVLIVDRMAWEPRGPAPGWAGLATSERHAYFPLETRSPAGDPGARERGFLAYRQGDCLEAERWLSQSSQDPEVLFYRGVCLYLENRLEEALHYLHLAPEGDPRWEGPSLWYRANLLLKAGKPGEARSHLDRLLSSHPDFRDRALALKRRLDDE